MLSNVKFKVREIKILAQQVEKTMTLHTLTLNLMPCISVQNKRQSALNPRGSFRLL